MALDCSSSAMPALLKPLLRLGVMRHHVFWMTQLVLYAVVCYGAGLFIQRSM